MPDWLAKLFLFITSIMNPIFYLVLLGCIYENASWPIRFVFTIPPMPNEGYVKIDHDYSTHKIFNFISSTCDFSDLAGASSNPNLINDIFSGLVGQRPVCFSVNDS